MKRLLKIVLALAVSCLAFAAAPLALAQSAPAARLSADARKVLVERIMGQTLQGSQEQLRQSFMLVALQSFDDDSQKNGQARALAEPLVEAAVLRFKGKAQEIVSNIYSDDELRASVAFYDSPGGQAMHARQAEVSRQSQAFVQAEMPDLLNHMMTRFCDRLKCPPQMRARIDQVVAAARAKAPPLPVTPPAPENKRMLARQLYTAAGMGKPMQDTMRQMIGQIFDQLARQMRSGNGDQANAAAQLKDILTDEVDGMFQRILAHSVDIMASVYSEDELKAALVFYQSPTGRSMAQKTPELLKASMEFGVSEVLELQKRAREVACDHHMCKPAPGGVDARPSTT